MLLSHSPARHAVAAPRPAPITLTFSQPATGATNLRVYSAQRGLLAGTASGDGTPTLTWQPIQPLLPGEEVSVSVPAALAGAAGGRTFSFRAAAAPAAVTFAAPLDLYLPAGVTLHFRSRLTLADLNCDGYLDIVLPGATAVYTALGTGRGSFGAWAALPLNGSLQGLCLADYNQDGWLDMLWAVGPSLSAAAGTGTGSFAPATLLWTEPNLLAQAQAVSVVNPQLADVNGDGQLDCFYEVLGSFSRSSTPPVTHYLGCRLNTGPGQFGAPLQLGAGNTGELVPVVDANNDDRLDFLKVSELGVTQGVGDGAGGFTSAAYFYQVVGRVNATATGDLNGDGQLDILLNYVSSSNGNGTYFYPSFNLAARQQVSPNELKGLQTVDLDGDGDLDVLGTYSYANATLNTTANPVQWWKNLGGGRFAAADTLANSWSGDLATGDLNGDGTLDLLTLRAVGSALVLRTLLQQPASALATQPGAADALAMQLYPNPAHHATSVQLPAVPGATTAALCLTDALGRTVREYTAQLGRAHELPLTGLAPGVYCLRVQAGAQLAVRRLAVE